MKTCVALVLLMISTAGSLFGQGSIVIWDESVNGPLSGNPGSPTTLGSLQPVSNALIGSTEIEPTGDSWAVHYDFFTFTVANDTRVELLTLQINKPNVWIWIGDASFSTQLAFVDNPSAGELLPQWGIDSLSAGTYGMYLANHDAQPSTSIANYRLDFSVTAVPEPSTISLAALGAAFMLFYRCQGRRAT